MMKLELEPVRTLDEAYELLKSKGFVNAPVWHFPTQGLFRRIFPMNCYRRLSFPVIR